MKKIADAKKKLLKRYKKAWEKVRAKNQLLNISKLALANNYVQFDIFKNIFLNPLIGNKISNNAPDKFLIKPGSKNTTLLDPQLSAKLKIIEKKSLKIITHWLAKCSEIY